MISVLLVLVLTADPWPDSSPGIQYGDGAGYGQAYYPENILGPPDPDATPQYPAFGEDELLTLGKDGWVILEFTDNNVINGEGVDFTVFENVLETGSVYFRECATVEVSQDGTSWIMFPWDPETLSGLAGVWPTTGEDPTDPSVSGGDGFDLEDLGLEWINFIRLTDCGDSVQDQGLFDLDAVAAVNSSTGIEGEIQTIHPLSVTSPMGSDFTVVPGSPGVLRCFSAQGRLLCSWDLQGDPVVLPAADLPPGLLLFTLEGDSRCTAVKLAR